MDSTLQRPDVTDKTTSNAKIIVYWIVTALFCLQMSFTAYAQLRLPQLVAVFNHLGFPAYFRVELSWAKLIGAVLLLAPVPPRLKEWGLRRLRHQSRLSSNRPFLSGRWPGRVELGCGYRCALGTLILPLAQPPDRETEAACNRRGCWFTLSAAKMSARVGAVMKKSTPVEAASASIDSRIKELGDWRRKMVAKVRAIIREADPEIIQ